MRHFFSIVKKAAPWAMAVLIFAYLFHQYKPAQIWTAVKHANLLYFMILAVFYFVLLYFVDSYTVARVLTRFGFPTTMKEILPARGVTYLIMNINYPASQAAFAYYLKRTRGIPIFEVLGIFFFIVLIDLYILITLAFVGSFFQDAVIRGVDIGEYIRTFVLIAYGLLVFHFIFWRKWFSKLTGIKINLKFIDWVRSKKVFCVFNDAEIKDYLKIALIRSPIHISIVLFLYVAVWAFGAHVPLISVVANVPIAFLIGTIPITPGGLGTTNVALVELMRSYVTGPVISQGIVTASELIFAVTISWMCVNYTLKTTVGVVWLQKVSSKLFKPTDNTDPKEVMSEATHLGGDI